MPGLEDAISAIQQVIQGVSLIGNAVVTLIRCLFAAFGIDVPDTIIRLATIIFIMLLVWKIGESMSKVVLIITLFLAVSLLTGFLTPLLNMVGLHLGW